MPRVVLLLVPSCAVCLVGCGGMHASETAFQSRASQICTVINTSPYLDTKGRFDRSLRKTEIGLRKLALLRPPAGKEHVYRAMLTHMRRIYLFDKAHEREEIAFARQAARQDKQLLKGQHPKLRGGKRLASLTFRQVGRDYEQKLREAQTLGLTACNTETGTARLHTIVNG
jgi:hypothetical protein